MIGACIHLSTIDFAVAVLNRSSRLLPSSLSKQLHLLHSNSKVPTLPNAKATCECQGATFMTGSPLTLT